MYKVCYNVFYLKNGEEKSMKIDLDSKNPSTSMAINKFKKLHGGLRGMKKKKISIVSCSIAM